MEVDVVSSRDRLVIVCGDFNARMLALGDVLDNPLSSRMLLQFDSSQLISITAVSVIRS
jgi:hypothetical protein